MSSNGHLSHSANGNGAHALNGLLNGNGSLKENGSHSPSRVYKTRKLDFTQLIGPVAFWAFMALGPCFLVWTLFHPSPAPPVSPRVQQIQKTIDNLQEAIDLLQDELPPPDDDHRQGEW